ncbi:hypothetical protein M3J09_005937 [Ascochyta lentis]
MVGVAGSVSPPSRGCAGPRDPSPDDTGAIATTWTSVRVTAGHAGKRLVNLALPGHGCALSEALLGLLFPCLLVLQEFLAHNGTLSEMESSKSTVFTRRSFWDLFEVIVIVTGPLGGVVLAL